MVSIPLPSADYCRALRGPGIPPLVARFDMSVPKILLIEEVRLAGLALATTPPCEVLPVAERTIVALCCYGR